MPRSSSSTYVIVIAVVAAVGGFLFGFDSGVINGTVDALADAFGAGDVGTGFSVASILLGCAVGAFTAGNLAERFGRRPLMLVTAIVFAWSAWGSGAASVSTTFIVYRVFGGLAVGAASVLAPAYISEVAPPHVRGRLVSLQQLAIVIGLFSSFVSNYFLAKAAGGARAPLWLDIPAWRWMFWTEILPSALFFAGSLMIPESPRFLVSRGRIDEATAVFRKIQPDATDAIVQTVKQSLDKGPKARLSAVFRPGSLNFRPVVWIGIALGVLQQFVGINVVFYYGAVLWQSAGFGEDQALLTNVITGSTNVVSTVVSMALVDRVGRRPLLLAGSLGMALTLGTLAYLFGTGSVDRAGHLELPPGTGTLALVFANLYVVCFAVTWGPIVWVLLSEIFENKLRGPAMAVATGAHWMGNFTVTMTFPILLTGVGLRGAYSLYAASAVVSFFVVWRFVRETKGRALEEMTS